MVANNARPETRQVYCTNCDRPIEIAAQAMSVNCRHCHKRVIIEDVKIKTYHAVVRIATAGTVEVAKKASVVAQVRVSDLIVKGTVKGDVVARNRVTVDKKAVIEGDVSCRSLSVQAGAQLSGHYDVRPDYAPPPPEDEDEDDD